MTRHTPPRGPSRHRAPSGRTDRAIIDVDGEDYPEDAETVMVVNLEELGIDPDSLATAPHVVRRLRAEAARGAYRPASEVPEVDLDAREDSGEAGLDEDDMAEFALIIGIALLPLLLSLAAAAWLVFG